MALVGAVTAIPAPKTGAGAGPLAVIDDVTLTPDGRLHELTLASIALAGETGIRVLLPAGYDDATNAGRRYPVLFLLHGVGDDHRSWTDRTAVEELTAPLDLIVVMPDAGRAPSAGWYSDWQQGPAWESYHIGELVPFVDEHYRTLGTREGRAVVGLSMGGFGAMSYAARHPELFVAAASFSGAVDTTVAGLPGTLAFEILSAAGGTPDHRVWGTFLDNEVRWRTHNPVDLASNPRWTALWLSTGTGVPGPADDPAAAPVETVVYPMNLRLQGVLDTLGIAHQWRPRLVGTHDWPYWEADLIAYLRLLVATLADPPAPPAVFDYRSAELAFQAWGWSFEAERAALEFVASPGSPQPVCPHVVVASST